MASLTEGTTTWSYTYDAVGMRTSRTGDGKTYTYTYNGSQLVQMTVNSDTLRFTYDAAGTPLTVNYNGTIYYYTTNLQGDVTGIVAADGTTVVTYSYDSWGKLLEVDGTLKLTLGELNPVRYRGYVYDAETALYYLQSRYYDPVVGRFINADAYTSTGQGLLGNNMFSYCQNNSVLFADPSGCIIVVSSNATEEQIAEYERAIAYIKTSETGRKLIELLDNSSVRFLIIFDDNNNMYYDSSRKVICFDINSGLIMSDGTSVQSAALGLAHEMGHAAQDLSGFLDKAKHNSALVEESNVAIYEKPIAKELGEPLRNSYYDAVGVMDMNNSTHFKTTEARPWWEYLLIWNWFNPFKVVDHNY